MIGEFLIPQCNSKTLVSMVCHYSSKSKKISTWVNSSNACKRPKSKIRTMAPAALDALVSKTFMHLKLPWMLLRTVLIFVLAHYFRINHGSATYSLWAGYGPQSHWIWPIEVGRFWQHSSGRGLWPCYNQVAGSFTQAAPRLAATQSIG